MQVVPAPHRCAYWLLSSEVLRVSHCVPHSLKSFHRDTQYTRGAFRLIFTGKFMERMLETVQPIQGVDCRQEL